jgi:hypothetical protein
MGRRLLIVSETQGERDSVIRFLDQRGYEAVPESEARAVIEDCDRAGAGLSTIVALVEEWRCAAQSARSDSSWESNERSSVPRPDAAHVSRGVAKRRRADYGRP